eukprot:1161263-Pelagomonas_calceolata.AAC.21
MAELCKGRGQGNVQCQTRLVRDASLSCGPSLLTASNTLQEDRRRSCMSDASLPVIVTHPDNGASRRVKRIPGSVVTLTWSNLH